MRTEHPPPVSACAPDVPWPSRTHLHLHLFVNGTDTGITLHAAHSWLQRARGLLGRTPLDTAAALWLRPCAAVLTMGMRHALDLVFLDRTGRVLRSVDGLRPFGWAACVRAHSVLEFQAGVVTHRRWQVGDCMHAGVCGP